MQKDYITTFSHNRIFQNINQQSSSQHKIFSKLFIIIYKKYDDVMNSLPELYSDFYSSDKLIIAIKATKKSFKTAVSRNKIRRRIKAVMYSIVKSNKYNTRSGFMIIVPKSVCSTTKYIDIESGLTWNMKKLDKLT